MRVFLFIMLSGCDLTVTPTDKDTAATQCVEDQPCHQAVAWTPVELSTDCSGDHEPGHALEWTRHCVTSTNVIYYVPLEDEPCSFEPTNSALKQAWYQGYLGTEGYWMVVTIPLNEYQAYNGCNSPGIGYGMYTEMSVYWSRQDTGRW